MDLSGKSYKAFIDREEALKKQYNAKNAEKQHSRESLPLTNESACFSIQIVLKKLMLLLLLLRNLLNSVRLKEHMVTV